jgi:hypothetical protein
MRVGNSPSSSPPRSLAPTKVPSRSPPSRYTPHPSAASPTTIIIHPGRRQTAVSIGSLAPGSFRSPERLHPVVTLVGRWSFPQVLVP